MFCQDLDFSVILANSLAINLIKKSNKFSRQDGQETTRINYVIAIKIRTFHRFFFKKITDETFQTTICVTIFDK